MPSRTAIGFEQLEKVDLRGGARVDARPTFAPVDVAQGRDQLESVDLVIF